MVKQIMTGVLVMSACAHAGSERYVKHHQLDPKHLIVVSEGDFEPRSIGSYAIRVYENQMTANPMDNFICGLIRPRDGIVEDVLLEDLDHDGSEDIVVTMRCVGTGAYLSADAFKYSAKELTLLASAEGLDKNADPVAVLEKQVNQH